MTVEEAHPDRRSVSRPPDDELGLLFRSLRDEREFVLIPRLNRLEGALKEILSIASDPTSPAQLARLTRINAIALEALAL